MNAVPAQGGAAAAAPGTAAAVHCAAAARAAADAPAAASTVAGLEVRVRELERIYRHIEATRMAGLGITHPKLQVAAVGFEPEPTGGAAGVLVTPWFMNLVWLPDVVPTGAEPAPRQTARSAGASDAASEGAPPPAPPLPVGESRARLIGREVIDFLGAHEAGFGAFETCSLFSPMFDFVDQAAALATADEVLKLLRRPPEVAASEAAPADPAASRRAFLLGRRAA